MTICKKVGSLLLSLLLVISMFSSTFAMGAYAATSPVLSVQTKTVNAGEQFTVAVSLSNATTVYGGNFTLEYDNTLLTADSYTFGSIVGGHTKNCNLNYQSAGNLIRFTFSGASALSSSGTLVTFTFTAKENLSGSAALKFNVYKMYDENGNSMTTTATGSTITISPEPVVSPVLSISDKTVTKGETFTVPVKITDSSAVYGGNFTLQYDSSLLTADSYTFGSIVDSHTKNCNLDYQSAGNLIRFTFSGASALSSDGTIITFTFTAKSTGTAALDFTAYKMYDENGSSIETIVDSANITIKTPDVPNVQSIWVYSQPTKDVYLIGETLDITGLKIGVKYYDGTTAYPTSGFTTSGFDSQKEGQQTITVSYGGRTTSFKVRVDADGIFTITFDANGGINPPAPITYQDIIYCDFPDEIPTRADYTFVGWATEPDSTFDRFHAGSSVSMSAGYYGDFTLYAIWELNVITGQCGDNAYYKLTLDSGEFVIYGTGAMWDYDIYTQTLSEVIPWYSYCDSIKKLIVEDGITHLGAYSFIVNSNKITNAVLSNTVESIGAGCFASAPLENIDLGGCTEIGELAFQGCDDLTSINLRNTKTIGKKAFQNCENLKSITIPKTVEHIGENAFWSSGVTSITILTNKAYFDASAFSDCDSLTAVYIDNIEDWCGNTFNLNNVTSQPLYVANNLYVDGVLVTEISIPESITNLQGTFLGCTNIKKVTIPKTLQSFDFWTFEDDVVIYGYADSKAEYYADQFGLEFIALDAKQISSILVYNQPSKTTYYIGDSLSTTGLKILVTYSDGTTEYVTSGFSTSGFSSTTAGTKTVTVTYNGKSTTFNVTIKTPNITLSETSKTLTLGDTATLTATTTPSGQSVTWSSNNVGVVSVSNGVLTTKVSGTATITAKFTYNGYTYSQTCVVTVTSTPDPVVLTSISVSSMPSKTVYEIGESLNTSGLKLKLTYSDGSTSSITSGFTTSGFSSTTAGTKTVTVSYNGKTTTFNVTVNPAPIGDEPTIFVDTVSAVAGETVTITVNLKNNDGFGGMAYDVVYDNTKLELTSYEVVLGALICTDSGIDTYPNKINFQYAGTSNITGDDVLVSLTFKIKDTAEEGFASVTVVPEDGTFFRYDGRNEIDFSVVAVNGGVNIVDYMKGDINGDGKVNNRDSARLLQMLAGWDVDYVEAALDVNGDGKINNRDAARILQYLAGWDVTLN